MLSYLEFGLNCTKLYRFVDRSPKRCFNNFVNSAADARRQGDENPNSGGVAKIMNLLPDSFYRYQFLNRIRHTVTKHLKDEKTHSSVKSKFFEKLDHVNDQYTK